MHDAWEGSERQGLAWRRLGSLAGLVALVALGWTALQSEHGLTIQTDGEQTRSPTEQPEVVAQPPVRAGARWVCPADHPVRAFDSGRYYPPEHPVAPEDTTKPQRCFLSGEWAEAGGYELAPPPAGAVLVGQLYVVPAVAPSLRACGKVAQIVEFAVPCPTRLPAPGRGMSCATSCLYFGQAAEAGVVIEQQGFLLPARWCAGCADHVVVAAVRDRSPPELISCGPSMAAAAAAGEPIGGYHDCPAGPEWLTGIAGFPHERHTLMVWEEGNLTYAVSMEGHAPEIRTLLSVLRGGIVQVDPAPQS